MLRPLDVLALPGTAALLISPCCCECYAVSVDPTQWTLPTTHPLPDSPRVAIDGHGWSAGDAGNPLRITELEVVRVASLLVDRFGD